MLLQLLHHMSGPHTVLCVLHSNGGSVKFAVCHEWRITCAVASGSSHIHTRAQVKQLLVFGFRGVQHAEAAAPRVT